MLTSDFAVFFADDWGELLIAHKSKNKRAKGKRGELSIAAFLPSFALCFMRKDDSPQKHGRRSVYAKREKIADTVNWAIVSLFRLRASAASHPPIAACGASQVEERLKRKNEAQAAGNSLQAT